jgi:hypothetical protein
LAVIHCWTAWVTWVHFFFFIIIIVRIFRVHLFLRGFQILFIFLKKFINFAVLNIILFWMMQVQLNVRIEILGKSIMLWGNSGWIFRFRYEKFWGLKFFWYILCRTLI